MMLPAFLLGLFGSLHCITMCGPIALAMPYGRLGKTRGLQARALYQSGRIFTYALLGLILGMIGLNIQFAGSQQFLSIAIGIMLILFYLVPNSAFKKLLRFRFIEKFQQQVASKFRENIQKDNIPAFFISGMLNGLLPCGMVWVALGSALALSNGLESAFFMALFGLGTVPALMSLIMGSGWIKQRINISFNRLAPIVAVTIGLLLIVRGLNMGTHWSPYFEIAKDKIITVCGSVIN